jgi:predicted nucleic acid-binding protein
VIYLDTSALVKAVFDEPESRWLEGWLTEHEDTPKITSELSTIELVRVCRRYDAEAVAVAGRLLSGLT